MDENFTLVASCVAQNITHFLWPGHIIDRLAIRVIKKVTGV